MGDSRSPLRFGIMCSGESLRKFQYEAVRRLIDEQLAQPVVLIVDDRKPVVEPGARKLSRRLTAPKLLWRLYSGFSEPPLLQSVPLDAELARLPQIRCRPTLKGRFSEYFSDEEVAQVASYDLDFILRFGFNIIRGGMLDAPRYGVWSFHHGDERRYRGGPPAFWEIAEGNPLTGAVLQRLTNRLDAGVILRRGVIKTTNYSYKHNFNLIINETIGWPAAAAREILNGASHPDTASTTTARLYRAPTNWQMLCFAPRLAMNMAVRAYQRQLREEWNIGAVRLTPEQVVAGAVARDVVWFPPFRGGWTADPCARQNGSSIHVLCERMRLDNDKGYIATASFDGTSWSGEQLAIDTESHASYPYLLSDGDQIYCIPETHELNEVTLYRATDFPNKWERLGPILQGVSVVDSTVFCYGDRWWLFCTAAEGSGHRLMAYYADALRGPWLAHPMNPIKTDPQSSRPAGPPFWVDGSFYRPAQDCSKTYGGRIAINKIVRLSVSDFEEICVANLEPYRGGPFGKALHTLAFAGEWAIIDGKRWRSKRSRA